MADDKDKKIPEVPHLENLTGKEKIPVSANGEPRYVEVDDIIKIGVLPQGVTPKPAKNQIVYRTFDGDIIKPSSNPEYIESNIYYPFLGFGVITLVNVSNIPAFKSNINLQEVLYGASLNYVQKSMFEGCWRLSRITFFNSLRAIDLKEYSFNNCFYLNEIIESSGVLNWYYFKSVARRVFGNTKITDLLIEPLLTPSIPDYCFYSCKNIPSDITFSTNITSIGEQSFAYCSQIERLIFKGENLTLSTNAFSGVHPRLIDSASNSLINFPTPDKLETLILRYDGVVSDLADYATTFAMDEEGRKRIELPVPKVENDSEIATMDLPVPIAAYIGTPNNWLKIYVPENLLKAYQERYPTLKNHFHPITGEDIYATKDEVNDAKKAVFIDLWNGACGIWGKYNEETGFFELNGLTDITYEEALKIYNFPRQTSSDIRNFYGYSSIRTNIPGFSYLNNNGSSANNLIANGAFQNSKLEVVNLSYYNNFQPEYPIKLQYEAKASTGVFYENPNLVRIIHPFRITAFGTVSDLFWKQIITFNPKLESFQLHYIDRDIWFTGCPKINLESFQWMITNARNTDAITITVEEGIYLALTGEAEYPFNGGTQEEWEQLLQDAIAKQISFATI